MKKNLKKLFALLLVVVMVAAMFAGCANNAETVTPEVTTPEDNTPQTLLPLRTTPRPRIRPRRPSRPVRTRSSTAAPPRSPVTSATHGGPTTPATRPSAT